jgi:hypothetical protein
VDACSRGRHRALRLGFKGCVAHFNSIVNYQHLAVPSGQTRVYSPAQGLYGSIYSPVSMLRPSSRKKCTHPIDAHLRAPTRARVNPSECTLIAGMWTRDHTLALLVIPRALGHFVRFSWVWLISGNVLALSLAQFTNPSLLCMPIFLDNTCLRLTS